MNQTRLRGNEEGGREDNGGSVAKMIKTQLVKSMAKRLGTEPKQIQAVIDVLIETATEQTECRRLAERAADIRVEIGEWVIREGEDPRFFFVLEGVLHTFKDIAGQLRGLDQTRAGEFFGEIPNLLGTPNIVSIQASSRCCLARFDRQQLQELIRYPICGARIFAKMTDRLAAVPRHVSETPSSRVVLSDS